MFKLLSLKFDKHPYLGNIDVTFAPDEEKDALDYTTLIIGPNGTGKSQILLAVVQIFNRLAKRKKTTSGRPISFGYNFNLRYRLHDKVYEITQRNNSFSVRKKVGHLLQYINEVDACLPSKILLSSYTFNDRYPLSKIGDKNLNDVYQYLGLKSTTNSLFISRPQRITIDNLNAAIQVGKDFSPLRHVFEKLGLKSTLGFFYKPARNYNFLFNKNPSVIPDYIHIDTFEETFYKYLKKRNINNTKANLRFSDDKYEKIFSDNALLNRLINYLQQNINLLSNTQKEKGYSFTIDFDHESSYSSYLNHALAFQILQDLEFFSFDRFDLTKYGKTFAFDNASSGEYHLLFIFINLLSFIEPNSLVLIDEPEISLHPNWQLQFMGLMKAAFKGYPTTQFIICTHSHFIVSDLHPENSNIVSLNFDRETNQIRARSIEKNTFAWSAEQILLEVFEVPTTRNFYLSAKISEILELMAKTNVDRDQISLKLQALRQYDFSNLSEADPFKTVINKLLSI